MEHFQARQGDIFFRAVAGKPTDQKLKPHNSNIFAYGELTGHAHRAISPAIEELDMVTDEKGDIYVLSQHEDIKVWHDEHHIVTLPKNQWICVSRQREYDPLAVERQRRVAD
jgi:hypothetical protein